MSCMLSRVCRGTDDPVERRWECRTDADEQAVRNGTIYQFPCDAMGEQVLTVLATLADLAIRPFAVLFLSRPQPATEQIISFLDITRKAFAEGFSRWRHNGTYFTAVQSC